MTVIHLDKPKARRGIRIGDRAFAKLANRLLALEIKLELDGAFTRRETDELRALRRIAHLAH